MKNHYHIVACIPIATLMQNPCDIVSNHYDIGEKPLRHCWKPLQHLYKTIATFVQNHCDICAKPLQHLCKTIATFVQNHYDICAKPVQTNRTTLKNRRKILQNNFFYNLTAQTNSGIAVQLSRRSKICRIIAKPSQKPFLNHNGFPEQDSPGWSSLTVPVVVDGPLVGTWPKVRTK